MIYTGSNKIITCEVKSWLRVLRTLLYHQGYLGDSFIAALSLDEVSSQI